ncbi:hypothetical protein HRI_000083000 [Hibiscus trionum]|uniref:RNase H type-1 domain-containing protein n=1 Tax=Hibiscus trionum TaxID=183268 RepID=A0A9W7GSA2_HIBTR|nr:hypothetical protein HRI_000083000 [Hibiscus trionum]
MDSSNFGSIKFNVDGSFYTNTSGCGGVLRSYAGDMRALFSGPVENLGPDFAKLMAIRTALFVFSQAGWIGKESLIVESDSQVVLNWIANSHLRPWRWWNYFEDIDSLAKKISCVSFEFVPRARNGLMVK